MVNTILYTKQIFFYEWLQINPAKVIFKKRDILRGFLDIACAVFSLHKVTEFHR
jgi:hypothetical protein